MQKPWHASNRAIDTFHHYDFVESESRLRPSLRNEPGFAAYLLKVNLEK